MRLKMKPRYLLVAAIVVAIPVLLLVLNTVDSGTPDASPTVAPPSGTAKEQAARVGGPVEANAGLTATPGAAQSLITPEGDGTMLLQTHCAQCHSVKILERTRKSRTEWEKTLARMEKYSGLVNDAERLMVLDHLAASDKP